MNLLAHGESRESLPKDQEILEFVKKSLPLMPASKL